MANEVMDYVFTGPMKNSVVENRVFIVSNLTNVEGILDYLVGCGVFADADDVIRPNGTRKEKVRDLLDGLVRRPAKDYWKFIASLYQESIMQGNIASQILRTYKERGGTVSLEVSRLQLDYNDRHGQDGQLLCIQAEAAPGSRPLSIEPAPSAQAPSSARGADPAQGYPAHFRLPTSSASSHPSNQSSHLERGRSLTGNVVTTASEPSASGGSGQQRDDHMDVDSGHQGGQGATAGQGESAYERARRETPGDVYHMASAPRGLALIIDNESFEKPGFLYRDGTAEDRQLLENMLTNIGFEVFVETNLRAEDMRKKLKNLSRNPRLHDVDSCVVAVMSHGSKEGIIFGVDGDLDGSGAVRGTYINVTEMRDIFSSTKCPALSTKPKLFIVQACRGVFEDTNRGVRTFGRDVVGESGADSPCPARNESMYQDMCWVHSSVEDMVGYRNILIPTLVDVFTEYAATKCIKEMMTKIQKKISEMPFQVDDGSLLYPVAEDRYTLKNQWFFNPPPSAP